MVHSQGQTAFCILQDAYITGAVRALCELKIGIARQGFGRLLLVS